MLALRMYQLDHDGNLPPTLSELAPTYLSVVPADPMRGDGKPFGYLPQVNPPILYSVGFDGIDDGGSTAPVSPGALSGYRWQQRDAVCRLTLQPASSSTKNAQ